MSFLTEFAKIFWQVRKNGSKKLLWVRGYLILLIQVPRASALGLLIPSYFDPSQAAYWEALNQAANRVPLIAIMNPNNGPTSSAKARLRTRRERSAKFRRPGDWIYLQFARDACPLAQVKTDVDRYDRFYKIDGFFIDEVTNDADAAHLAYYGELYNYIKSKQASYLVVGNPGINTLASYLTLPAFDGLVTFENDTGYPNYVPDAWTQKQSSAAFSHLCYNVATAATMTNYAQLAVKRNAGYIYITDDKLNNPWDTLTSYWKAEVDLVEFINHQAASNKPAVLSIGIQNQDRAQVQVSGSPGRYVLQASPNLTNWGTIATNISGSGEFSFLDTLTNGHPLRSYRTTQ